MKLNTTLGGAIAIAAMFLIGCQTAPKSEAEKEDLETTARSALTRMQEHDPNIDDMIQKGNGYVIFPNAGKGAFVLGGGYGKGVVFDDAGTQIGFADITQLSAGAQIGGQGREERVGGRGGRIAGAAVAAGGVARREPQSPDHSTSQCQGHGRHLCHPHRYPLQV